MSRPGFAEGVGLALLGAVVTPVLAYSLLWLVPSHQQPGVLCLLLGMGYGLYLLARSPAPAGRLWLAFAWVFASLLSARLFTGLWPLLAVQLGMIWLTRSWCFHRTPLAALLDLGLLALGTAAAVWALAHSGSLHLAAWTWLLTQALFVLIPQPGGAESPTQPDSDERFTAAERAAERALQRLAART
ncbi:MULTISPECIES: hypothetical protein [Thiorhodovibrio]|uniref:hypothetical protein n=1 Tax=Thiorhodovibrio TaxID=61593 RepID=UPI001914D964|nr:MULTISPECIES: hypothetical protein [Thiorhodovibrio]MBK5967498.1 hypothetical protein [Thiorhodovibrio winogradskyi]WPL13098.1 hypothetical protein Thiosp_02890 [Thiorhodovibrio litoralis]